MKFAKQIEYNRRLLVEDLFRRLEAALQPVADALNEFFAVLFSARLPADWREQWHAFIAELEADGYRVEPQSVREFEDWIEAWARYCELLPVAEKNLVLAAADANDLLAPKLTTTQTVPRYRNGQIVGGIGGDVSAGQPLSEAVPIFFEVAVSAGGVFFEPTSATPLSSARHARDLANGRVAAMANLKARLLHSDSPLINYRCRASETLARGFESERPNWAKSTESFG